MDLQLAATTFSGFTAAVVAFVAAQIILEKRLVEAASLAGAIACVWKAPGNLSWTQSALMSAAVLLICVGRLKIETDNGRTALTLIALGGGCIGAVVLL